MTKVKPARPQTPATWSEAQGAGLEGCGGGRGGQLAAGPGRCSRETQAVSGDAHGVLRAGAGGD